MARPDIPLPEISTESPEEFERSWIRFTYVAAAKEWDDDKQMKVVPTLLRGQLLHDYISLSPQERVDLSTLKKNLAARAGLLIDPLTATKHFQARKQRQGERVNDLKRLFKGAFPDEPVTSKILLNKFVSDLCPDYPADKTDRGPKNSRRCSSTSQECRANFWISRTTGESLPGRRKYISSTTAM